MDTAPIGNSSVGGRADRAVLAILLLATALSLLLMQRSQVGGDQLNLLARGWFLAAEGRLIPYGNPGSGGGAAPGPASSVLVGVPLMVWRDARAPVALVLASHLLAFVLLDRVVRQSLGDRARLLFAVLYGLSPTRLYFSGFLWNPSYLFLAGAVHAWTAFRQRHEARFFESFLHVLMLGIAAQLHASAVILCVASLALWLRGLVKVHWPGAVTGAAVAGLTLIPYFQAIRDDPGLLPVGVGFPFRGLLLVFPLLRGLLNWLRYASLSVSGEVTRFDFSASLGRGVDSWLSPSLTVLAQLGAAVTIAAALAASLRFYRVLRARRASSPAMPGGLRGVGGVGAGAVGTPDGQWLENYVLWCFLAAFVTFCIAPTTPMWWQGVSVMHAAVIPLLLWVQGLSTTRWRWIPRRGAWAWGTFSVLLIVASAWGSPQFRCGGRHNVVLDLVGNPPMVAGLSLLERCPFAVDEPAGWWPDVLPRPAASAVSAPAEVAIP